VGVLLGTLNREAWLEAVAEKLRGYFFEVGQPLPPADKLAYATGFPSKGGRGKAKRRIGECWSGVCTPDGTIHILISPVLADPIEVAATLVHELVHAAIGNEQGHGPAFKAVMKVVGLEGKPTATHAGDALKERLAAIVESVGPYPHQPLSFADPTKQPDKARMLKLVCPEHRDYIVRASRKVIDSAPPRCGMCGEEMEAA
jgi:hypothetical protein